MIYYCDEKDILNLKDNNLIPVIPVNCKGVMGAGLALQFKNKYTTFYNEYVSACNSNEVEIGHILYLEEDNLKFILFPTKDDWKNVSKLEYIDKGLDNLLKFLNTFPTLNIAIPPLGCGCGKLSIEDVLPLIYNKLKDCKNDIFLIGF